MMRYHTVTIVATVSLLAAGCSMSVSSFQTAEVIPEGKASIGAGFGAMGYGAFGVEDSGTGTSIPILEIFGRYGLAYNVDAGVKYGFPWTIGGDVKVQLTKHPLAIALDPAWSFFRYADAGGFVRVFSLYPQILVSTKMVYFGAKGVFATIAEGFDGKEKAVNTGFLGGCVGLRLGCGKLSLLPELNYLVGISGEAAEGGYSMFQPGIGFVVTF